MNSEHKKDNSLLFNLITLLTFGLTLFLIIFLKQRKGKKTEQYFNEESKEESRVKNSVQEQTEEKEELSEEIPIPEDLNTRQKKILAEIESRGIMEPSEIYELVPQVSTRTIRRDMDKLVEAGFVLQRGTTKSTQYIYKN
jgi:predicted HTH transcriptional regulator